MLFDRKKSLDYKDIDEDEAEQVQPFSNDTSAEVQEDEHDRTVHEYERLNNNQLGENMKSGMTSVKKKSLGSTIAKFFRENIAYLKDALKSGKEKTQEFSMNDSYTTEGEQSVKSLKKGPIYVVVGLFFLIVILSLVFGNSDTKKKAKTANPQTSQPGQMLNQNNGLNNIPKSYGEVKSEKPDNTSKLKKDVERNENNRKTASGKDLKTGSSSNSSKKTDEDSRDYTSVRKPVPRVPTTPQHVQGQSQNKSTAVKSPKDVETEMRQKALSSRISFGIHSGVSSAKNGSIDSGLK